MDLREKLREEGVRPLIKLRMRNAIISSLAPDSENMKYLMWVLAGNIQRFHGCQPADFRAFRLWNSGP